MTTARQTQNAFDNLRVVLVATRNPLNLGAAARAMSNFGVKRLRVVNPYDPAFREAKSAVGASHVLKHAEVFGSVADAVADCTLVVGTTAVRHRELQHQLRRLEEGARLIRRRLSANAGTDEKQIPHPQLRVRNDKQELLLGKKQVAHAIVGNGNNVALLFGSEKRGLSNADLSYCHWLMRIPTHGENISMNLGQAVAVCLYELARDAKAAKSAEKLELARADVVERMTGYLFEALEASGYFGLRKVTDVKERMRRLVRRLNLPARDADVWLGIMHQIVWKLRGGVVKGREEAKKT
ncbi:MAG TPA: TrmH family RNA methyltransferase [Candidatus Acidoferrales bacterium]|jgi:tRNA/rRNA methyltransferase|nr:TrmH family RNA methyltransferase [Candidatus Acidoferrales bacterium]